MYICICGLGGAGARQGALYTIHKPGAMMYLNVSIHNIVCCKRFLS